MSASTSTTILYHENALVIQIATTDAAALHHSILRGLITSLKNQILRDERIESEVDAISQLADVLTTVLPTEKHLAKAFRGCLKSPGQPLFIQ